MLSHHNAIQSRGFKPAIAVQAAMGVSPSGDAIAITTGVNVLLFALGSHGDVHPFVGIGIRLRHWVSFHGFSLNVDPDLEHFSGIVPCGLKSPVTSLAALGADTDIQRVDKALRTAFEGIFGAVSANSCR